MEGKREFDLEEMKQEVRDAILYNLKACITHEDAVRAIGEVQNYFCQGKKECDRKEIREIIKEIRQKINE